MVEGDNEIIGLKGYSQQWQYTTVSYGSNGIDYSIEVRQVWAIKHPGFHHMKVVDEFFRTIFHRLMVMKQDRKGLVSE